MPSKGTQPNHYITDLNNHTKTISDTGKPMSDAVKKSLSNEIDKIISDSKEKAKEELAKRTAPKTNWITKIGSKDK